MIYRPSRDQRRRAAGQPCALCGRRLHHLDMVAASDEVMVRFAHAMCVEQVAKETSPDTGSPEATLVASEMDDRIVVSDD